LVQFAEGILLPKGKTLTKRVELEIVFSKSSCFYIVHFLQQFGPCFWLSPSCFFKWVEIDKLFTPISNKIKRDDRFHSYFNQT